MVVGPTVTVAGERSARDALISGALATRFGVIADRLVPPSSVRRGGSGNVGFRGHAVPDTLLGPEETDHGGPAEAGLSSV